MPLIVKVERHETNSGARYFFVCTNGHKHEVRHEAANCSRRAQTDSYAALPPSVRGLLDCLDGLDLRGIGRLGEIETHIRAILRDTTLATASATTLKLHQVTNAVELFLRGGCSAGTVENELADARKVLNEQ